MVNIPIQQPSDTNGYGSTVSQDLGISPASVQALPQPGYYTDGVYVLKFSVQNQDGAYPGYYTAGLFFGTQELCEASGWAMREVQEITVVGPSPTHIIVDNSEPGGGPAQGRSNLIVTWSVDVWPIFFRNVSLTFTPTN